MRQIQKIRLDDQLLSLIGFAQKSRTLDRGFEAVRRGIQKQKTALVLVDETLAQNSLKKIWAHAQAQKVPVLMVKKIADNDKDLIMITGYKILGLHQGGLAVGFVNKLKQENQWL